MPERSLPSNAPRDRAVSCSTPSVATCGRRDGSPLVPARRPLAIGIWSALLVADAVLIARCLSGEWVTAPPPLLAVVSMILVAGASQLAWLAFQADSPRAVSNEWSRWIPAGVALVASALWCLALAAQSSSLTIGLLAGVTLFQLLAVLTMTTAEQQLGNGSRRESAFVLADQPDAELLLSPAEPPAAESALSKFVNSSASLPESLLRHARSEPAFLKPESGPVELEPAEFDPDASDDITQWLSRRATDDGEVIEGWMRATFLAGQREATIHVSFCPPLSGSPEIETEDLDGSDLEIRVASIFPFGLRMTARRSGSTREPQAARIGFVATAATTRRAA